MHTVRLSQIRDIFLKRWHGKGKDKDKTLETLPLIWAIFGSSPQLISHHALYPLHTLSRPNAEFPGFSDLENATNLQSQTNDEWEEQLARSTHPTPQPLASPSEGSESVMCIFPCCGWVWAGWKHHWQWRSTRSELVMAHADHPVSGPPSLPHRSTLVAVAKSRYMWLCPPLVACPSQHGPGQRGKPDVLPVAWSPWIRATVTLVLCWWQHAQRGPPRGRAAAALYPVPSSISYGRARCSCRETLVHESKQDVPSPPNLSRAGLGRAGGWLDKAGQCYRYQP